MSEEISYHQNSAEVIYHKVMTMKKIYSIMRKKRMSQKSILPMQLITYLGMIMTVLFINIIHHFYHQIITNLYLLDQNMVQQNEQFAIIKILFWIYY